MKCFMLDSNGDVVIKKNKIEMVEGSSLTAQTVRTVLGTNKGEWFGNTDEGITFSNILGKSRVSAKKQNYTQKSGDLSATEEMQLAARLRNRLDGDA